MPARALRIAKWVILPLLAAWLAYLILGNIFVNAKGLELTLEKAQDAVTVEVGSAFTWWPGRVTGRDLRIVVHDSNVEMDLRIDSFDTSIRLLSLLDRELETRRAKVTGVTMRARKTRPLAALCKQGPGLPPIHELAAPAGTKGIECTEQVDTARTRRGPPTPAERLYRVRLSGLVVRDLREAWIEKHRVTGRIGVDGRMYFWPTRRLGFDASDLRVQGAALRIGETEPISGADLEGRGRMLEVQLDRATAEEIWNAISFDVKTHVRDIELMTMQRIIAGTRPIAPPQLPRIEGRALLKADLTVENGRTKLASIHMGAMQASLHFLEQQITGHLEVDLRMVPASSRGRVLVIRKARALLRDIEIQDEEETHRYGPVEIEVTARGTSRLSMDDQRVHIDLVGRASRSEPLLDLIPGGLKRKIAELLTDEDEPATFSAELYADPKIARFESLHMQADNLSVSGRVRLAPEPGGRIAIDYRGITIHQDI